MLRNTSRRHSGLSVLVLCLGLFASGAGWTQTRETELPEMPAKIYDKVSPATVRIICENGAEFGTGTIVGISRQDRALILTNTHVVARNFDETDPEIPLEFFTDIKVKIASEPALVQASVLLNFVDRANDIALIGTNRPVATEQVISYTLSEQIKPGQIVSAFGYPASNEVRQTVGSFIEMRRNFLVFDAAIAPGNSGGPVIDKKGRMVGMSTYLEGDEGFAISMNLVSSVVNGWLQNLKLKKAWRHEKDKSLWQDWRVLAGGVAATAVGIAVIASGGEPAQGRKDLADPPGLP